MKRVITANITSGETSPAVEYLIERIGDFLYNAKYDVTGHGVEQGGEDQPSIHIEATYRDSDSDNMPKVKLVVKRDRNYLYVLPTLTFPQLSIDGYTSYNDTIHYWLQRWEDLGRYITQVCEYSLDIEDIYNREDD